MASVLDGIRVLDCSGGIAGPITGMLLADHGAEVIKVEPPGGDRWRTAPGADVWLRGRRSIELDLRGSDDHAVFRALAASADVVLETYGPGTARRLGVDAATLLASNPRLIVCSISAYGHHSAHRGRPGYDALVAARLGLLDEQRGHIGGAIAHMHHHEPFLPDLPIPEGMEPGSPRSGPILTYTPWPSMCAAFLATTGISAALFARTRTGRGQHVETSLLQAALALTASKWLRAEHHDAPGFRTWIYDQRAAKGMFRCSDGRWIQHWVPNPRFVLSSADGDTLALRGTDNIVEDPERITPEPENLVVLAYYYPLMAEAFARFPSDEWVAVAAQANVPLQPVRTPEEALADDALLTEGAVVDVEHPSYGALRQAGILYGLSRTPGRVQGPVPTAGEHNDELRAEVAAGRVSSTAAGVDPGTTDAPAGSSVVDTIEDGDPCAHGPLSGITVLDLGFAVAGPFGTQVLADLGANVIKVNARRDPWWHATAVAYGANRGKRSVGLDLKHPDGLAALYRLVERADVVHSNMRRDALRRLRCDEASIRAVNPDVVYCHTRGFDRGPRSDSPGNDQTGCSLAGVTFEDGGCRDGGKPFWSLTSLGDTGNGFLSAIGVIQALLHRAEHGEAQSVDTSILNAGLLVASMAATTADGTPLPRPALDGLQLGLGAGYRLYQAADGWVCIALVTDDHWRRFAAAIGEPELLDDPRFADAGGREKHRGDLEARLVPWFAARPAAGAFAALDGHGVPCEITDPDFGTRIHDDPEMLRLGLVVKQDHPKVGRFEQYGRTIDFSDTPADILYPPPVCGQHTREVLAENGFTVDEIEALVASGAAFDELWVD
ncbi:MAG: putative CoA-transferase [Acidimicrobiia bacterium]